MANEINKTGLTCQAVYGGCKDNNKNFELYKNKQIGRGLRHYEDKECLYLIDVVDQYKAMLHP